MFKNTQVLTATKLLKNFSEISKYLHHKPQALLITQKSRENLVLVNADIFQDLLDCKFSAEQAAVFYSNQEYDYQAMG
jgi:hypothetical protein